MDPNELKASSKRTTTDFTIQKPLHISTIRFVFKILLFLTILVSKGTLSNPLILSPTTFSSTSNTTTRHHFGESNKQITDALRISPKHTNTLPPKHTNTLPPKHTNTLSPKHTNTLPPKHTNTLPPKHTNTLPPKHTNTLPPKHTNTLPPNKINTLKVIHQFVPRTHSRQKITHNIIEHTLYSNSSLETHLKTINTSILHSQRFYSTLRLNVNFPRGAYNDQFHWKDINHLIDIDQSKTSREINHNKEDVESLTEWKTILLDSISNMSWIELKQLCQTLASKPSTPQTTLPCKLHYEENHDMKTISPKDLTSKENTTSDKKPTSTFKPKSIDNLFDQTNNILHMARIKRSLNSTQTTPVPFVSLAILVPIDQDRPFCFQRTAAAIEIAIQRAQLEILPSIEIRVNFADSHCSISDGMNAAIEFYARGMVNVFMGPVCDYAVAPIARQIRYWEIPLVTPGALALDFGYNKPRMFPFLTRLGTNFNSLLDFLQSLIQLFQWTKIKMLYHPNGFNNVMDRYCHIATDGIVHGLRRRRSNVTCDHKSFHSVPKVLEDMKAEIGNTWSGRNGCGSGC